MGSPSRLPLGGTELSKAAAGTIRLKLLRIGAVVTVSVRQVTVTPTSACLYQAVFVAAVTSRLRHHPNRSAQHTVRYAGQRP